MSDGEAFLELLAYTAGFTVVGYIGSKIGKYAGEVLGFIVGGLAGIALVSYLLSKRKEKATTSYGLVEVFSG